MQVVATGIRKNGKNGRKDAGVVDKHERFLKGTGYEDCIECAGCGGRLRDDGLMHCSRAGARPLPVTVSQAQACDGTKPPQLM